MSRIEGGFTKGGEKVGAVDFTIEGRVRGGGWDEFWESLRALLKRYGLTVRASAAARGRKRVARRPAAKKKAARKKAPARKTTRSR